MRSEWNRNATSAGTSLLEVLCAISVLSVGAFGATQIYIAGLTATREADQELVASRLMANEIDAWRVAAHSGLHPQDAAPLRSLDTEDRALPELDGDVRVTPSRDVPQGLFELTVHLRWHGAGGRTINREVSALLAAQEIAP